jgi:hypothetical protein
MDKKFMQQHLARPDRYLIGKLPVKASACALSDQRRSIPFHFWYMLYFLVGFRRNFFAFSGISDGSLEMPIKREGYNLQ